MNKTALQFRDPQLSDAMAVQSCTKNSIQSDLAFANIYLLRHKYGTKICLHQNTLYRYFSGNGRLNGFAFPTGQITDIKPALFHVEQYAREHHLPLKYCLLTEENAETLSSIYGEKCTFTTDRGDADYLYKKESLTELNGSHFHKKRNHISRFIQQYPEHHFEPLCDANKQDALQVTREWMSAQESSPALIHELRAIENALTHTKELGIFGGVFYVELRPVSMSLASMINQSVADIHYEKCIPQYRDAYPMINRSMAKMLRCEWINREEDLNIPGLRQAKLSYKPSQILKKLSAEISLC